MKLFTLLQFHYDDIFKFSRALTPPLFNGVMFGNDILFHFIHKISAKPLSLPLLMSHIRAANNVDIPFAADDFTAWAQFSY